jgi:GDP-L-fucose synthase
LSLGNTEAVYEYIKNGDFDIVVHSANPNPVKNTADEHTKIFEDSLKIFMNLYNARNHCEKLLYIGSGAEFDKRKNLLDVTEDEIGQTMPADLYGFSKYIMNEIASSSLNLYNLRLFACYGPYDHESKFITHAIRCCLRNEEVTIRQDCYFDYLHIYDFGKILAWFIDNTPDYKDYNICRGIKYSLLEIAREVCSQMGNMKPIKILSNGFNNAYTASNNRLLNEIKNFDFISLEEGISMQIKWEKEHYNI